MSQSILLSIGCNTYDTIGDLNSAELDAERMHAALTSGPAALYSPAHSKLIKSPRRSDVEGALKSYLQHNKDPDVFTFFFAGHAGMRDGSLYLCPRESDLDALSVTAINISQILRIISELRPRHAYIILDACESGGVAFDLNAVLRSDVLSKSPGFSLSILCAAQFTQGAGETSSGGYLAARLLDIVSGARLLNDAEPFLGLGDMVKAITLPVPKAQQQSNFWSLNITGADAFCRNPHHSATAVAKTPFDRLRHSTRQAPLSSPLASELWRFYLEGSAAKPETLPDLFAKIVNEYSANPIGLPSATYALTDSIVQSMSQHPNTFACTLVHAAMIHALLPHQALVEGRVALETQLDLVATSALDDLIGLESTMSTEKYHLVGPGALPDLYYLPKRISMLLGWIGYLLLVASRKSVVAKGVETLRRVSNAILAAYGNSIVCVSDEQAPPILLFLSQCKVHGWVSEAEEIIGRLYLDFNTHYGRIIIDNPSPSEIVDFLLLRQNNPPESEAEFLQNPTELLSVILVGAAMFDLDDAIDASLVQIDHSNFCFYIPSIYEEFCHSTMEDGQSIIFQLGHALTAGYGVWNIGDMHRVWRHHIEPVVRSASSVCSTDSLLAAAISSLIVPDRIAWFSVPKFTPRMAIPRPLP